jgi:hypothetical protein
MKTATIKNTYTLDVGTVADIDMMSRTWGVAKSEVIRRSVRAAATRMDEVGPSRLTPLQALAAYQRAPGLAPAAARAWMAAIRRERSARHPARAETP